MTYRKRDIEGEREREREREREVESERSIEIGWVEISLNRMPLYDGSVDDKWKTEQNYHKSEPNK